MTSEFGDTAIRLVQESDAEAIAELFRLNYGEDYAYPEVFDGGWVKKCIYNDGIICLVLEDAGKVIGTCALLLDFGDYNDQIGELARLVVHPDCSGHGEGTRLINGLFRAAQDHVEFAVTETRTAHITPQKMVESAEFTAVGFLPHYFMLCGRAESCVIYAKLYGNCSSLRSRKVPQLIPEIAPLASQVLTSMQLGSEIGVAANCTPYPAGDHSSIEALDRDSLARLARIEEGRSVEPLLFGGISLDQGYSLIRRRNAVYLMAVDDDREPIGAVGYQHDHTSKIVKGIEMVGKQDGLRGHLCESLLDTAVQLGARIVEVNISAYDPRLQQTFLDLGFKPVAYMPAFVFHAIERLDVVKMLKLNIPYDPREMKLTVNARGMVDLIAPGF